MASEPNLRMPCPCLSAELESYSHKNRDSCPRIIIRAPQPVKQSVEVICLNPHSTGIVNGHRDAFASIFRGKILMKVADCLNLKSPETSACNAELACPMGEKEVGLLARSSGFWDGLYQNALISLKVSLSRKIGAMCEVDYGGGGNGRSSHMS